MNKNMSVPITVIILNYNGSKDTINCVNSLLQHLPHDDELEIVIVDNKSTDESVHNIKSEFGPEAITLLISDENAGFAAGNNIGIRNALKKGEGYICLLNNDTIAVSDFLSPCIDALEDEPLAAVVSPGIIDYYSGNYQNTGAAISLMRSKARFYNSGVAKNTSLPERIRCDMVQGCCMIFHTALVDKIGMIPEYYFMYFEETEWCWRSKKKGYHALSLPGIVILHKGKASIGGNNKLFNYIYERNRVVFAKCCMYSIQFMAFIVFDFIKCIYRAYREKISLKTYINIHLDGLLNKVNYSIFDIPNAIWKTDIKKHIM